jgi:hypothetical protein
MLHENAFHPIKTNHLSSSDIGKQQVTQLAGTTWSSFGRTAQGAINLS